MLNCVHIQTIPFGYNKPFSSIWIILSFWHHHTWSKYCYINFSSLHPPIALYNLVFLVCLLKIICRLSFNSFTFQWIGFHMSCNAVLVVYVGISDLSTVNVMDLHNISDVIHSLMSLFLDLNSNGQRRNNY